MPPWRLLPGGFAETVYARSLVVIKAAQIAEDFKATGITCLMFQASSALPRTYPVSRSSGEVATLGIAAQAATAILHVFATLKYAPFMFASDPS